MSVRLRQQFRTIRAVCQLAVDATRRGTVAAGTALGVLSRSRKRLWLAWVAVAAAGFAAATPSALADDYGDEAVVGTISYSSPLSVSGCQTASWSLSATTGGVNADLVNNQVAGLGSVTGSGSSGCASMASDAGTVTLSFAYSDPTGLGSFSCGPFSGSYLRTGLYLSLRVWGTCVINGQSEPNTLVTLTAMVSPTSVSTSEQASTFVVTGTLTDQPCIFFTCAGPF